MRVLAAILFAGGGSIGHVAPCIAVWREVERQSPGSQAFFICSPRAEEAEFLQKEGVEFVALPVRNPSPLRPFGFVKSFLTAWAAVSVVRPDVVFSKGGGISVPVALVALLRRIPVVLHESDAVSGKANRLVGMWAKKVCTGFPGAYDGYRMTDDELRMMKDRSSVIHHSSSIFTGNPVRPDVLGGSKDEGRKLTGLDGSKPVLLVIGGSQGAQALNSAIVSSLDQLLELVQIIHITGAGKGTAITRAGYWSTPFAYGELKHLYAASDLALSRSGAGAIAELAANGIPIILVPLRGVAHDHQQVNALAASKNGGCVVLEQSGLGTTLVPTIRSLDAGARAAKSAAVRALYRPDAVTTLARIVLSQANAQENR